MKNLFIMFCILVALSAYPLQQHTPTTQKPTAATIPPNTVKNDTTTLKTTLYRYIGKPAKNLYAPLLQSAKH